jgi:hypothetical protein
VAAVVMVMAVDIVAEEEVQVDIENLQVQLQVVTQYLH